VEHLRDKLLEFTGDVFASLTRAGWPKDGSTKLRIGP
jgi:hypothetical protein